MGDRAVHRVVVVGGGFGGLATVRLLSRTRGVDITLVDRRNHHLFQPLLYQVATGILSPGQIAPVLRHIFRKRKNVRVELAQVEGFDLEQRIVHANTIPGETREYPYDSLIVAAGAGQTYFGHDEYARIAPAMKTLDDALELRRRIYGAFEMAENSLLDKQREFWLTIVVVGAGPTGVELAGQVRELAVRSLKGEFRRIDPSEVRVLLLDGGSAPLANFGDQLSGRAREGAGRHGRRAQDGDEGAKRRRPRGRRRGTRRQGAHHRGHHHLGGRGAGLSPGQGAGRRDRDSRSTGPAGSQRSPTSPWRVTPRCSSSATW